MNMKILITGGHFTPALALIEELQKDYQIVFVGRKNTQDKDNLSLEYQEITNRKIPFYNLSTGRSTKNILQVLPGIIQAKKILTQEKPDLVISFGGYLGFPVCFAAMFKKIPFFIHEQTCSPGIANRVTSLFAKKIFVAFSEAANFFPKTKTIVSGNPLRKEIFQKIKQPFSVNKDQPLIYVTGGSLGAHSINLLIEKILPQLLEKYLVVHQTGNVSEFNDFKRLSRLKNKNYFLTQHLKTDEIGNIYALADLVVSRAGANAYFELLALKKPAILIPLPWSAKNEQQKHAKLFKKTGGGEIFNQQDAPEKLKMLIDKMFAQLKNYQNSLNRLPQTDIAYAVQIIKKYVLQELN